MVSANFTWQPFSMQFRPRWGSLNPWPRRWHQWSWQQPWNRVLAQWIACSLVPEESKESLPTLVWKARASPYEYHIQFAHSLHGKIVFFRRNVCLFMFLFLFSFFRFPSSALVFGGKRSYRFWFLFWCIFIRIRMCLRARCGTRGPASPLETHWITPNSAFLCKMFQVAYQPAYIQTGPPEFVRTYNCQPRLWCLQVFCPIYFLQVFFGRSFTTILHFFACSESNSLWALARLRLGLRQSIRLRGQ